MKLKCVLLYSKVPSLTLCATWRCGPATYMVEASGYSMVTGKSLAETAVDSGYCLLPPRA